MKKTILYAVVMIGLILSGAFISRSVTRKSNEYVSPVQQQIIVENKDMEYPEVPMNTYPYDLEEDRKKYDANMPDLYLKDSMYQATINDWYMNFNDYQDKVIWIEGFYFKLGKSTFVGRVGPTCPFCNGGYVSFEFHTDQNLDDFVSEDTWIRVKGILREGRLYPGAKRAPYPLYYLNALEVEEIEPPAVREVVD